MSNNFEKFGTVINDDPANKALDWDAEIEASESEFRLLEKGQYDFTVAKFERANFEGSAKVPPCPLARLTLTVHDSQGDVQVFNNLFLTEKTAWKIAQFFVSIKLMKKGDKLKMNWSKVIGAKGRLSIKHREYNGKTYNEVDNYIAPKESSYTKGTF
mgnify:CR=1 FL=1